MEHVSSSLKTDVLVTSPGSHQISDEDRIASCRALYEALSQGLSIVEAPELGPLVRPSDVNEPFQRWFLYREGFTAELGRRVLRDSDTVVLDPFCGFGSTLLAARQRGIQSIGLDVSPLAALVSRVKTRTYRPDQLRKLRTAIARCKAARSTDTVGSPPVLRILGKLFHPSILDALLIFKNKIDRIDGRAEREFLLLGWISILETVSNVFREGNGVKYKNRLRKGNNYTVVPYEKWQARHFPKNKFEYVKQALLHQLEMMFEDIQNNQAKGPSPKIFQADAGRLSSVVTGSTVSLALFSPPYCNCFNYIKAYKLELWMAGFIQSYPDIKLLTAMGIRSRLESLLDPVREPYPEVVERLVALMDAKSLWSGQIPDVLRGYFADMTRCLTEIHSVLKPGGRCVIVVGNSAYAGVVVPSDLLLARIAKTIGFSVDRLDVARHLTTSSQQKVRVSALKDYLRETVIHLSKPPR